MLGRRDILTGLAGGRGEGQARPATTAGPRVTARVVLLALASALLAAWVIAPSAVARQKRPRALASVPVAAKPTSEIAATPSATRPHWACPRTRCLAIVDPPVSHKGGRYVLPSGEALEGSGEKGGLSPSDLESAYNIPSSTESTQTVAVVDVGGYASAEADLAKYREHYGLAACTKASGCFKQLNVKGEEANYPPEEKSGWIGETALDMEMVSAACPSCRIMVVEGTEETLEEGVETAVTHGATEVSLSFGGYEEYLCEAGGCTGTIAREILEWYEGLSKTAPITAAAGDEGWDNSVFPNEGKSPSFPASITPVIAVGGTRLVKSASAPRGWTESVWEDSGSGCSAAWPQPGWQSPLNTGCPHRLDNDVAAVGSCYSPVSVYTVESGGWANYCGTSASAPLVAGILAHASAAVRSAGARAFYEGWPMFDVKIGHNATKCPVATWCAAAVGYDGPSGMGEPDGVPASVSPYVSKVEPEEGSEAGGTTVTISGSAFEAGDTVSFGGTPATSSKVESLTSMTAVSPPGIGTVDVTVAGTAGTSLVHTSDQFTYGGKAHLSYNGATEAVAEEAVALSATMTDLKTSAPVAGYTVKLAVGAESCQAVTNASGVASCSVQIGDAPGSYTATAKTTSGSGYVETSTSAAFTVLTVPVFGRCVKVASAKVAGKTVYSGRFTSSKCTEKSATQTGKYEWLAGPGPNSSFTVAMKPSGSATPIKLETTDKHVLVCKGASGTGKVTGLKTATIGITLTGCTDGGQSCTSFGEPGVVSLGTYNGELAWLSKSLNKVALRLWSPSLYWYAGYECETFYAILGSAPPVASGILLPVTADKASAKATLKFAQSKGKQVPSALEGGPTEAFEEERNTVVSEEEVTTTTTSVGLSLTLEQTYEEGYEVNALY